MTAKIFAASVIFLAVYVILGFQEGDHCGGGWTDPLINGGDCFARAWRHRELPR
jgi:hypothetical protein